MKNSNISLCPRTKNLNISLCPRTKNLNISLCPRTKNLNKSLYPRRHLLKNSCAVIAIPMKLPLESHEMVLLKGMITCMLSGILLPSTHVIAGHLFKWSWKDSCFDRLGFRNIDDPRNGLLLFKPFEYAFDNSHMCFEYSADLKVFQMRILDTSIRTLTLRDYILRETQIDQKILQDYDLRVAFIQTLPQTKKKKIRPIDRLVSLLGRPFGEFEGKSLINLPRKCYSRCLSFQAMMAKRFALEQLWIGEDEAGSLLSMSMWSELEQTKKDQIHAWFQGLRSAAQKQVEVIEGSGSDSDE
ncbi:hypothetical protein BDR26DRAFT_841968 [Obelidium mucronatum]|nr:hypothetical protein BDR26DRAFT_841968 [Obelidium mucronatum]